MVEVGLGSVEGGAKNVARGATPLLGQREVVAIQLPEDMSRATAVIFGADSNVEVFDCATVMLFRGTA